MKTIIRRRLGMTLGAGLLVSNALFPLGGCLLGGCGVITTRGNGEYYFKYGTKIAFGQHTEKSDETQVATSEVDWSKGPTAWMFEWLLREDSPEPANPATTESTDGE